MNNTRLLTISQKNLKEIDAALKACDALLAKTNQYESTLQTHKTIIGFLRVLHTSYAARLGRLQKGHMLTPYTVRQLQEVRGEAILLAAFAIQNKQREDTKPLEWKKKILDVFDLAIARAEWLEGS